MAMLAEPKQRQKWSLNPRGNAWSNDDNKFGQKLMEKMGWSKGTGLGREGQGMKEHISVKLKDNSKGLGYQGKDDEWVKHFEGFENVLATLNSEENSSANSKNVSVNNSAANSDQEEGSGKNESFKSLEAMSKTSRARVHYHKFTRGKDVSRYNADDIGCILGSKRARILAEAATQEEIDFGEEAMEDETGHMNNLHGVTTIKGGNVQDYFAQKLKALAEKSEGEPTTQDKLQETSQELNYEGNSYDKIEYEDRIKKPKKKKKTKEIEENGVENNEKSCSKEIELENGKKKKKKKRKKDGKEENLGTEKLYTEESLSEIVKKKKKKDGEDENKEEGSLDESVIENENKKKKKKGGEDNGEEENLNESVIENEKKKKKKEDREEEENIEANVYENEKKKKKKKRKYKEERDVVDEKREKKKKRKYEEGKILEENKKEKIRMRESEEEKMEEIKERGKKKKKNKYECEEKEEKKNETEFSIKKEKKKKKKRIDD